VQQCFFSSGQTFRQPDHETGMEQRLHVTMRVNRDLCVATFKQERVRLSFEQLIEKFLEQETAGGDGLRAGQFQLAVILDEHRVTRWLEEKNRSVPPGAMEQIKIMPSEAGCFLEVCLDERGSPGTFAVCEKRDLEAERFQNFDGSDPDVWFVITDESVVPEN